MTRTRTIVRRTTKGVIKKLNRPIQRALDAGDCRFVACGIFKHFAKRGFEFFLLPSIVHARSAAMLRERKPLGAWSSPDFDLCSVHANPKGVMFRLGLLGNTQNILLAGPSNFGFTDPAQGTAFSLGLVTVILITTKQTMDNLVLSNILLRLESEIGEEFLKVQEEIEERDATQRRLQTDADRDVRTGISSGRRFEPRTKRMLSL